MQERLEEVVVYFDGYQEYYRESWYQNLVLKVEKMVFEGRRIQEYSFRGMKSFCVFCGG